MKIIYTLVFSCFTIVSSFGQISLTSADFGSSGDTVRMTNASNLTVDYATTGANQNWDFTQFTPSSQTVKRFGPMSEISGLPSFVYGSFASANYKASYYMDANIPLDLLSGVLPIQLDDIYQYSKKSATAITLLGLSLSANGTAVPAKSDTIETKYSLPLNYGDVHFSRAYTKLNLNPLFDAQWIQHRTRNTTVDGWGQLTTVYGTHNVLRLKHDITESDSLFYTGTWIGLPIPNSTEYEWIAAGEKIPLLKITTTTVMGVEQVTAIEYRDNQILATNDLATIEAEVYPNPTSELLNVNLVKNVRSIQLIDATGKIVMSDSNPVLMNEYSLTELNSGMYQLVITNDFGSRAISIVKK